MPKKKNNKPKTNAPAKRAANTQVVKLVVTNVYWARDLDDCRRALIELSHIEHKSTGGTTHTEIDFYSHPTEGWQINRLHYATYAARNTQGQSGIVEQNEFTESDADTAFYQWIGVPEPRPDGPNLHSFLDTIEDEMYEHGIRQTNRLTRCRHGVLGRVLEVTVIREAHDV